MAKVITVRVSDTLRSLAGASGMADQVRHDDCVVSVIAMAALAALSAVAAVIAMAAVAAMAASSAL